MPLASIRTFRYANEDKNEKPAEFTSLYQHNGKSEANKLVLKIYQGIYSPDLSCSKCEEKVPTFCHF